MRCVKSDKKSWHLNFPSEKLIFLKPKGRAEGVFKIFMSIKTDIQAEIIHTWHGP